MNREAIKEEENNLEEYRKKYQNALKAQQAGGVYVTSSMSNTGYSTSWFDNTRAHWHVLMMMSGSMAT